MPRRPMLSNLLMSFPSRPLKMKFSRESLRQLSKHAYQVIMGPFLHTGRLAPAKHSLWVVETPGRNEAWFLVSFQDFLKACSKIQAKWSILSTQATLKSIKKMGMICLTEPMLRHHSTSGIRSHSTKTRMQTCISRTYPYTPAIRRNKLLTC